MDEAMEEVLVAAIETSGPKAEEVLLLMAPLSRRAEKSATCSSVNPWPGSNVLPFGSLSLSGSSLLTPLTKSPELSRGLG